MNGAKARKIRKILRNENPKGFELPYTDGRKQRVNPERQAKNAIRLRLAA